VDPDDGPGEIGVHDRAVRQRPRPPGVVPGAGHPEHPTEHPGVVVGPLRVDEPERRYRRCSSRAKKEAAFFRDSSGSRG